MTNNQPLSLFISSSMKELADERRAVQRALKKYNMLGWLWEIDAGARPEPIRSTYLTEVAACDIYIGLFWLRYGAYTIEEFEHAHIYRRKPCLIYEKYVDIRQRDPQLEKFLAHIQRVDNPDGLTVCRFETPVQLAKRVQRDVMGLLFSIFRRFHQQLPPSSEQFAEVIPTSGAYYKEANTNTTVNTVKVDQTNKTLPGDEW